MISLRPPLYTFLVRVYSLRDICILFNGIYSFRETDSCSVKCVNPVAPVRGHRRPAIRKRRYFGPVEKVGLRGYAAA
jgi:hypothetical protein